MKKLIFSVLLLLMTVIGAVAQNQLNEGFESTTFPPDDWTAIHVSGENSWGRYTANHYEGSASVSVNWATAGHENYLVTPLLVPAADEALSFYISAQSYSGTTLTIEVSTTTATADAFTTTLATYTTGSSLGTTSLSTFVEKTVPASALEAYVGQQIYIAFHVVDNNGARICIDNVSGISIYVPSCPKPTAIAANNLTTTSVDIAWTPAGAETTWTLKYGPAGFDVETEGATETVSGTPEFSIENLTANTAYDVYVKAVCSESDESDWKSTSFRTACGAITSFPWSEDFESYSSGNFTAPCWVNEHISGDGTSIFKVYTSTNGSNTTHQLQLPDMNGGTLTKLVLPEMNFGEVETAYVFSIDVYRSNSTYNNNYVSEGVRVFASTNGNIEGATEITFIPREYTVSSAVVPAEDAVGWYTYELNIPITTGTCFIILQGESQYCTSTYMDNFVVKEAPSCLKPTALSKSNVAARTVDLSWTAGGTETAWQICLNDNEGTIIDVNTNPYTLTGLTPETAYNVKVRAKCSESDFSEWTSNISFTTTVACLVPTALAYADVTTNSVVLSWTAGGSETAWQICINNNEDDLVDVTENPYTLTGLTPATTYSIKVRANCGDTDGNSQWTSAVSFTTECEALAVDADHPYTEGFEDVTGSYAIPTCWERIIEYTSYSSTYPYVATNGYTTYSHGGDKALYMSTSSYNSAYENLIALPVMNGINTLQISLWAKASSTIPENFEIGYIKNGEFTFVKRVTLTTSYQPFVAYLNEAPADAERIAIRAYHSTTSITVYVDDIEVSEMPTCITPVDVVVSGITTNAASVSWTDVLPATAWQYQLNEGDIENVDAKPINLTGLTANTEYTIKVRTVCGENENSDWAEVSFTTLCDAVAEFPWIENFNSLTSGIPSCWDNSEGTTTDVSYRWNYYATGHEGAGLRFDSYNNGTGRTSMLKTVSLDLTELTSAKLEFWYKNPAGGDFSVYVSTDGGATYMTNVVATDLTGVANWTNATYDISSYCGNSNVVIVFVGTSNYGYGDAYIYLDDVIVRPISTGAEILTYTLPTEAAPASITSGANTGTIDITVTNSTNFDADLNPTYTISDYAEISAPVITGDGDSRTIRYTVTAEAGNSKVWTVNVTKVPVSRDAFITGFTFAGQKAGTTAEIVSNTESNIYTVHAVAEWNVDLTSIAPEITISPAAEITPESGYARDFTSPVTYTVTAEDGTTFHIYNVTIINDPYACVNPSAVNANDITDATATLSWAQAYTETSYIVKVSTEEMTNMAATADVFDGTVYATTKALENLTANTQYFVYVQSNCDNAEGWTEYSFRTECGVFAVPFVETFENNSETVNCWTAISNNTENDVASGKMGIFDVSGNNVFRFSSYSRASNEDYNQYLITPELALTEDAVLTFDYAKSNNSNENFRVMTSTTDANIASFTALGDDVTVTSTNFTEYRIVVPAATRYIAINYFSNYQYYLYVDNFKLTNVYTITASADPNGSIDPNGNVEVEYGESQSFTITPDECYHIASVIVDDNVDVTDAVIAANGVYTFADVTANHTIAATFAFSTYNITTTVEGNGSINGESTVNCGDNKSFIVAPANTCYRIASFTVDGVDAITDLDENGVYAMQNITADHVLAATFEQITYTITATAGENGTITETSTVNCGDNKEITITPANCYRIASVLVDDVDVTPTVVAANGVYTFENVMSDHTIEAAFEQITYTFTVTADANGSITANDGNGNVANCGENKMLTIEANDCYHIASVLVDDNVDVTDAVIAANGVYTFENVNAAHTIAATFAINTYAITTTVEGNGTITETSTVNCGANKEITITPASNCYRIASVIVDETENVTEAVIAANGVYTFENVIADHNIAATFEQITYTITATAGENGTITETSTVNCGDNKEITITPANCYRIASVLVDDVDVTATVVAANGVYTFENVMSDHTIEAAFEQITYTFTVTADANGSITANDGNGNVANCGENKAFTITANEGYRIASVIVDETENVTEAVIAAEGVYTFENVTADHTIAATFERVHTISAGTGADGSIAPEGIISVLDGESQTFTITPVNECFRIGQVMVDGVDVTDEVIANNGVYTFENVTENHNIVANFDAITLTITATAGEGGTITHNSDYEIIPCASNESYTIVANEGYRIVSVIVDGEFDVTNEVVANNGVYTFTNVRANHTIAATFELIPANTYTITATAGDGGTITPSGEVVVYEGDDQAFNIAANEGYRIASVIVDETEDVTSELVNGVYTFENVTANHAIAATFVAIPTYTLTIHYVKADNTPAADDYVETFAEGEEYMVVSPVIDGYTADQLIVSGAMPAHDEVVNVTYTINTYTIRATAGANGTITPEEATVNYGASQAFTISANEGYRIVSVMVDETENVTEQLVDGVYTFVNVTANHTIAATFEAIPTYTLTIHYVYADNTPAADDHIETLVEGAEYSVSSPVVTGYTANQLVVEGIMPAEDVVVNVTYTINTYTITASAGENGSITPSGEVVVNYGATQAFTITADDGYRIMSVLVDGAEAISDLVEGVYTFANVAADHTIAATFVSETATTYTITATAGENGTITPSGAIEVVEGENKAFTIEAATGYHIASVMVDDVEAIEELVDGVYTFTNVTENHTIAATFAINTYTITATAGDNGTINPAEATVNYGASQEFTITPDEGYRIASVMVDETVNVTEQLVEDVYTFENVTANHAIHATFEAIPTYTITATANEGGSINPAEVTVVEGGNASFTITANEGFRIVSVMVDENANVTEQLVDGVYTFANVTANHTIAATFEAIPTYTITATAGEGGSINPAEVTVVEGGNALFTITANEGYRIASVIVDATTENEANVTEQLVEGVYTIANVTANHTIAATFEAVPGPVTYTITVNAGENGTVTYNGEEVTEVTVTEGATPAFVITPATGYQIGVLTVDETEIELTTEQLAGHTYTFDAVEGDHTLAVTFVPVTSVEMFEVGSMTVYPNPNNGMFSIDFSNIEGDATYQIINASGAVVETRDINVMNGETMNFSHDLRPGTYFVRIISGDKVYVEQIVVE